MNKNDVYYRAFKNYRKETLNVQECVKDRNAIKNANVESDKLESTKYLCLIDEDWVEKIEQGLKYVEKAIAEGRQFIRTNSEVVPIEKVKRISRESVEHLAKHSDMITRVPENPEDNLVPDEILMVEKLTDFAVYENRFLYMLLIYLLRFIDFRLDKIAKLRATYLSDFSIKKLIETKGSEIDVEITLREKRTNNPYPLLDAKADELLKRVNDCKSIVNALLNTELMQSVSKAPMLKPPITKTNVLKMNNNFKNSLALYEYVASYKGEGFTAEEITKQFAPFEDVQSDEIADSVNLVEFITYKYGNEINALLENEYQKEELRRKEEEAKRVVEQIRRLKKKIAESGKSMEEYMLMLENRNKVLEYAEEELIRAKEEIANLNEKIDKLNAEKAQLNDEILALQTAIEDKEKEIIALNEKYLDELQQLNNAHAQEVDLLKQSRESEINDAVLVYTDQIDKLNSDYANERNALTSDYENKVMLLTKNLDEQMSLRARDIEDYQHKLHVIVTGYDTIVDDLEKQLDKSRQERTLLLYQFENKLKDVESQYIQLLDSVKSEASAQLEKVNNENQALASYANCMISAKEGNQVQFESRLKDVQNRYSKLLAYAQNQSDFQLEAIKAENKALSSYASFMKGELVAIRQLQGVTTPCDDFSSKERLRELEEEFIAFKAFFKAEWQNATRSLRDNINK